MENSSFSKRNHIGFYTSWMFCAKFVLFDVFNFKGAEQLSCRFPGVERNNPNLLHVKIRPKYIPARSPKHSMNAHWIASRETRRQTPKLCARYELAKNCMELLWFSRWRSWNTDGSSSSQTLGEAAAAAWVWHSMSWIPWNLADVHREKIYNVWLCTYVWKQLCHSTSMHFSQGPAPKKPPQIQSRNASFLNYDRPKTETSQLLK